MSKIRIEAAEIVLYKNNNTSRPKFVPNKK